MYWGRLVIALWLFGMGTSPAAAAAVRVVATIYPIADMVQQVGGGAVEVVTLLPAGASPHTFEPTPAQVRAVADAAVFVEIGAGLDVWAGKLKAAHAGPMTVITLTSGLSLLGANRNEPGDGDPHIWLDPVLVRDHLVPSIAAGLSRAAPAQKAAFEAAAAEFQAALTQLDTEIRTTLAPVTNRNYIAFHSAWRYFGQRYGLHEVAAIETFPGKEPSAQEIAAVVEKARATRVRALLLEPQFTARMAEQIAREIGARLVSVDPLGGSGVTGREHYLDLMRYNQQAFVQALL